MPAFSGAGQRHVADYEGFPLMETNKALPAVPCFSLGRVLVESCCERKRVYQCTTPAASGRERTTLVDCAACEAYDPDDWAR